MLIYIGIGLFAFWLILVAFKLVSSPRNRSFSYFRSIFGSRLWYKNANILILLIALYLLVFLAPIKTIYLLLIIASFVFCIFAGYNFYSHVGNPWSGLLITLCSLSSGIVLSLLWLKM